MPALQSNFYHSTDGFEYSRDSFDRPISSAQHAPGVQFQNQAASAESPVYYTSPTPSNQESVFGQDYDVDVKYEHEDEGKPASLFVHAPVPGSDSPWTTNSTLWNVNHQPVFHGDGQVPQAGSPSGQVVYEQYRPRDPLNPQLGVTQAYANQAFSSYPPLMPPNHLSIHRITTMPSGPQAAPVSHPAFVRPKPKYYVAHQPIPPEQQSKYTEFARHLEVMRRYEEEEKEERRALEEARALQAAASKLTLGSPGKPPSALTVDVSVSGSVGARESSAERFSPITQKKRRQTKHRLSLAATGDEKPSEDGNISSDMTTPSPSSRKLVKDLKKPVSLACIFCKERKIMCGRPPADAEDQTCNQCARRKFVCEYPKEGEKPTRRRHS